MSALLAEFREVGVEHDQQVSERQRLENEERRCREEILVRRDMEIKRKKLRERFKDEVWAKLVNLSGRWEGDRYLVDGVTIIGPCDASMFELMKCGLFHRVGWSGGDNMIDEGILGAALIALEKLVKEKS